MEDAREAALGSIPDTGHTWDDDPAQWVRDQRGNRDFALSRAGSGPGGSVAEVPEDEVIDGFAEPACLAFP